MRADNYFSTNKDLTFYYEKVIDWQRLVPLFAEADDAVRPSETAGSWRDVLGVAGSMDEDHCRTSRRIILRFEDVRRNQGAVARGNADDGRLGPWIRSQVGSGLRHCSLPRQ